MISMKYCTLIPTASVCILWMLHNVREATPDQFLIAVRSVAVSGSSTANFSHTIEERQIGENATSQPVLDWLISVVLFFICCCLNIVRILVAKRNAYILVSEQR